MIRNLLLPHLSCIGLLLLVMPQARAQFRNTEIRGFADVMTTYQDKKAQFSLEEQDLFITSDITDRVSFLGESVFKYSATSPTLYDVSIERIVLKYNYKSNHNVLIGKLHTPLNYWNDTYHHGRSFILLSPDRFCLTAVLYRCIQPESIYKA